MRSAIRFEISSLALVLHAAGLRALLVPFQLRPVPLAVGLASLGVAAREETSICRPCEAGTRYCPCSVRNKAQRKDGLFIARITRGNVDFFSSS